MTVTVTHTATAEWTTPVLPDGLTPDQLVRGQRVRRQGLAKGEGGFHASHVAMPAGLVTDPHHHDHSELIVILRGSMRFHDGTAEVELVQHDSAVIDAGQVYGFVVGDAGVEFLLVRTGKATAKLAAADTSNPPQERPQ
jgi:quercetin dioxygenase-like cupin family protein